MSNLVQEPKDFSTFSAGRLGDKTHFEHNLVKGGTARSQYSSYLADHHICEIYVGERNWREFGQRYSRIGGSVDSSIFLPYENDLVLSISNQFNTLSEGLSKIPVVGKVLSSLQKAGGIASGAVGVQQGLSGAGSDLMLEPARMMQASFYKETSTLKFSPEFNFRFGQYGLFDAKKEVFDPALTLYLMCLPIRINDKGFPMLETPGTSLGGLLSTIPGAVMQAGEDFLNEESGGRIEAFLNRMQNLEETGNLGKTVSFIIGPTIAEMNTFSNAKPNLKSLNTRNVFSFDACTIRNAQLQLGKDKDMQGYPTSASVTLTMETMMPASANDITGIRPWRN